MTVVAAAPSMSIVVLVDAPSAASGAPWRAAWIARHMGASLLLLRTLRADERPPAGEDPLHRLALQIGARFGITVGTKEIPQGRTGELLAQVRRATLLVVGSRGGNTLRERIGGLATERLIRLCNTLVLVVKRPCNGPSDRDDPIRDCGYHRVLVAVRPESEVGRLADIACALAPSTRVDVFHALAVKAPAARQPLAGDGARSASPAAQVAAQLGGMVGASSQDRCLPTCGWGSPGDAVIAKERAVGAELLVLGKRHRGLLADFFLGAVTQHVLSASRADVLVVPRLHAQPATAASPERLGSAG